MHGHNYRLVVHAEAKQLDATSYVLDFAALKSAAARPHKTFAKIKPQAAPSRDASPGDDVADFTVFTTENPADLAVTATAASGHVGDTVSIAVTVKNNGPATVTDAAATITAPSGTTIVDQLGCATVTAGKVVKCTGTLKSGESNTGTFKFRIDNATVGPDGKATIASSIKDPNLTNNTAAITITVLPTGLPITGARAGLIGGAGLAVLLVGGVLVVMARRRRYVLVAPRDTRD